MKKIIYIHLCIFSFSGVISVVQAQGAASTLLARSSQTLKFESQKTEDMTIVNCNGFLRKMDDSKEDTFQKEQNKQRQSAQQTSEKALSISSEFLEAENTYKITVKDSTGGGVIVSNQLLQEALADGYQTSAECSLPVQTKAYEARK